MVKIDLLFGILLSLMNKKNLTAQTLAVEFDISVRTVYRYLSVLDTSGIPVATKSGRGGGVRLYNTAPLQTVFFTPEEKMLMLQLTQQIKDFPLKVRLQSKLLLLK